MECQQALRLLNALINGEITADDRARLDAHLAGCAACRQALADLRRDDEALRRGLGPGHQSADVAEPVTARLHVQESSRGPRCSLLVVDDEPAILAVLERLLANDFEVLTAGSAAEAHAVFARRPVDLILTDQTMPRGTGVELLEWVQQHYPRTVRLLITGYADLESALEAINRGRVYHYLLKPWKTEDLLQTLRNAAEKFVLERSREQLLEELCQLNRQLEERVAERTCQLEEANRLLAQRAADMEKLALTDPLTGLNNRRAIEQLAAAELKRHIRYPSPLALGLIDVDHFKQINTTYLHTGGDEVLKGLARILTRSLREVDSVGRVGGEEFLVVAPETGVEGAAALAERIRCTVAETPIRYHDHDIPITVSLGFAVADVGVPATYEQLSELAAGALGHAKQTGRNRFEVRRLEPTGRN